MGILVAFRSPLDVLNNINNTLQAFQEIIGQVITRRAPIPPIPVIVDTPLDVMY